MISKLGFKRVVLLFSLGALLAILFVANEWLIAPKVVQSQQELASMSGEISNLQSDLDKMRGDFSLFEQRRGLYENMSLAGFFGDQDRVIARQRFDTMQKLSKIISARYEIKAAQIIKDEASEQAGYIVMKSPISVELSALDDLDIYRFIYFLNYGFPGHITINNLMIERKSTITPDVLKAIGTGAPPALVTAKMDLDWRTMVRTDEIKPESLRSEGEEISEGGAQ